MQGGQGQQGEAALRTLEGGLSHFELLVGAQAFWRRAAADMAVAKRRALVQAMTFEGDAAGLMVAADIAASGAADRRVLVDDYSRHVISDRFVHGPAAHLDPELRTEVRATHAMFTRLVQMGISVRVTNPSGLLFFRYPARNHKKLIVADNVAYIGGVNFSDHNFTWRDFMLRVDDAAFADACAADFDATFAGQPRASSHDFPGLRLISMDGRANRAAFRSVVDLVAGATRQITVISAYLTFPMTDVLAAARRRGVAVQLITPRDNNKAMVRDYLLTTADEAGFDVRLLSGMSHLKGMLIDDAYLVIGSSNFDFVSLGAEEELVAIVSDPGLIADFRRLIIDPALAEALPPGSFAADPAAGRRAHRLLKIVEAVVGLTRNVKRGAYDYPV